MGEFFRNIALAIFKWVNLIPLSIFVAKALEVKFQNEGIPFTLTDVDGNPTFASNFIEWFGILYGILLPLMLVRVWEQLDAIDREFDREADAVKLLYEDIYYLPGNTENFAKETAKLLSGYVKHVMDNYRYEVKPNNTSSVNLDDISYLEQLWEQIKGIFKLIRTAMNEFLHPELKDINPEAIRIKGDKFLHDIRTKYKKVVYSARKRSKETNPFVSDIFQRLNDIVDIRGDRIGFASQRLFESLRLVALITSIIFVLPFYFVSFNAVTPPLDKALIIGVTLLVIFIYLIIDDFDEPFGGTWRITDDSWSRVLKYMDDHQHELDKGANRKKKPRAVNNRGAVSSSSKRKTRP